MTTQNPSTVQTTQDELLQEWHKKAWLKRLFLPGDFLTGASMVGSENLVCRKTTMEYLDMNDQVEAKTMKGSEAGKYSTDVNYRPREFKNETLKILNNAAAIQCDNCSGRGDVTCRNCSGRGEAACSPTQKCGRCSGAGQRRQDCYQCNGRGEVRQAGFLNTDKARCMTCSGSGKSIGPCDRCGGRGQTICDRCKGSGVATCGSCKGSGLLDCARCGATGELVQGNVITRKFSRSTEQTYQLTGLPADEFKNGLDGKHFNSMTGDLVSEEFQPPAVSNIVLQRQSVHSYDVLSRRYSYQDAEFCLNKITSGSGSKYAASGLPLSKGKVWAAIAGGAAFSVVLGVGIALSMLL